MDGMVEEVSLSNYKESIIGSIENMMESESSLTDAQQHTLKVIRAAVTGSKGHRKEEGTEGGSNTSKLIDDSNSRTLTIYTLASHMSEESVLLGIEPGSLYTCLARLYTQSLADLKGDTSMTFTIPESVAVTTTVYDKLCKMSLAEEQVEFKVKYLSPV